MARLHTNRSALYVAVTWLFIAALFADSANMADPFSRFPICHPEEETSAYYVYTIVSSSFQEAPPGTRAFPHEKVQSLREIESVSSALVFVDQDSPSLTAESVVAFISIFPSLSSEKRALRHLIGRIPLYLLLRTLRI